MCSRWVLERLLITLGGVSNMFDAGLYLPRQTGQMFDSYLSVSESSVLQSVLSVALPNAGDMNPEYESVILEMKAEV
jgi:hypothetical protein